VKKQNSTIRREIQISWCVLIGWANKRDVGWAGRLHGAQRGQKATWDIESLG
jgi:hypothetical protein